MGNFEYIKVGFMFIVLLMVFYILICKTLHTNRSHLDIVYKFWSFNKFYMDKCIICKFHLILDLKFKWNSNNMFPLGN